MRTIKRTLLVRVGACALIFASQWLAVDAAARDDLREQFAAPPDTARPGVYWYFMDGNM